MKGRAGVEIVEGEDMVESRIVIIMMTTFCTWNVRGLRKEEQRWAVKDMVKRWKIGVFSLQEMKLHKIDRWMTVDMWGRMAFEFVHKPTIGKLGGILVAWDLSLFEAIDHRMGEYSILVLVRSKADNMEWAFSGIYGSCDHDGLDLLREELGRVRVDWEVPWGVVGDFNAVQNLGER